MDLREYVTVSINTLHRSFVDRRSCLWISRGCRKRGRQRNTVWSIEINQSEYSLHRRSPLSHPFDFQVKDANASTAPEFLKKLKDAEGNEGKSIRLEAEVDGSPKPDIEWSVNYCSTIYAKLYLVSCLFCRYRGTKELSSNAKYSISREGDRCILVINNVTPDDIDEYSIKIRNKGGAKMSRCNINVRCKAPQSYSRSVSIVGFSLIVSAPPRLRLPQKYHDVLNYDKGEVIVIKIPYTGSPVPNVTLTKDGQDLSNDRNVSIDVSDRSVTLTIRNTDKNTSGPYKIKLENNLGEDEATLRINVSGKSSSMNDLC